MERAAFEIQPDFQALRQNELKHGSVSPFGLFQVDFGSESQVPYEEEFPRDVPKHRVVGAILIETVTKNLRPVIVLEERARFKQRTFAGKPLSDDEVIQATQLAGEIEDELSVRRLGSGR